MPQQIGELVVIFCDEIDVALVLDRRLRSLQRLVEVGESLLLVLGRYFLVGLDLCDLRLDHRCLTSALIGHNVLDNLLSRFFRSSGLLSHLRSYERYDEPETLPYSIRRYVQ